jgi:hypothetical protein
MRLSIQRKNCDNLFLLKESVISSSFHWDTLDVHHWCRGTIVPSPRSNRSHRIQHYSSDWWKRGSIFYDYGCIIVVAQLFTQCQNCERNRCAESPSPVTSTVGLAHSHSLVLGGMNQWTQPRKTNRNWRFVEHHDDNIQYDGSFLLYGSLLWTTPTTM